MKSTTIALSFAVGLLFGGTMAHPLHGFHHHHHFHRRALKYVTVTTDEIVIDYVTKTIYTDEALPPKTSPNQVPTSVVQSPLSSSSSADDMSSPSPSTMVIVPRPSSMAMAPSSSPLSTIMTPTSSPSSTIMAPSILSPSPTHTVDMAPSVSSSPVSQSSSMPSASFDQPSQPVFIAPPSSMMDPSTSSPPPPPTTHSAAPTPSAAPEIVTTPEPVVASPSPVVDAPTTTTSAAVSDSTPAPVTEGGSGSAGGSGSSGSAHSGKMTYYAVGMGSCGHVNSDSEMVVAMQIDEMASFAPGIANPNLNPICGKQVKVTSPSNPTGIVLTVVDTCPGCVARDDIDVSLTAFRLLGNPDDGKIPISWSYV